MSFDWAFSAFTFNVVTEYMFLLHFVNCFRIIFVGFFDIKDPKIRQVINGPTATKRKRVLLLPVHGRQQKVLWCLQKMHYQERGITITRTSEISILNNTRHIVEIPIANDLCNYLSCGKFSRRIFRYDVSGQDYGIFPPQNGELINILLAK